MPGSIDEAKWTKAKEQISKDYPDLDTGGQRFWKMVQTIYKNMESIDEKVERKLAASDNPTTDIHATDPSRL